LLEQIKAAIEVAIEMGRQQGGRKEPIVIDTRGQLKKGKFTYAKDYHPGQHRVDGTTGNHSMGFYRLLTDSSG
jgi:hypothetical protein